MRRTAFFLVAMAFLAGCVPIGGMMTRTDLYRLNAASDFPGDLPDIADHLLIEPTAAPAGIDTPRIALSTSPNRLDYFAGRAWTNRAAPMVQALLVESFENSGHIHAVGRDSVALRADYAIKNELRAFQVEYDGDLSDPAPKARVRLSVKLICMDRRRIIDSTVFESIVSAKSTRFDHVIIAFDAALETVLE
ncbi:MAG: ABC-type transport auxiliary lipoprotein family protein, partial [Pseudomonadota bacterium]|nr:ABC-type transport auxiliary lipoprotein family protein [Pseudomonadota bacterium]